MKEAGPKEEITLERHVWRAFGMFMIFESVRILANGWEAKNAGEAIEHLILGVAIPAWYIWGQGTSAMLRAGTGRKVNESEFRDWAYKDITSLFNFLKRKN